MGDVNHICISEPFCLCVGQKTKWDECACMYVGFARCEHCGAAMKKIDMDTGESVLEHCKLQWVGRTDARGTTWGIP